MFALVMFCASIRFTMEWFLSWTPMAIFNGNNQQREANKIEQ